MSGIKKGSWKLGCLLCWLLPLGNVFAGVEGVVSGSVLGLDSKAEANVAVRLLDFRGKELKGAVTDSSGNFSFSLPAFGDYEVTAKDAQSAETGQFFHLASGESKRVTLQLQAAAAEASEVVVSAHKNMLSSSLSSSRAEISSRQIDALPGGNSVALPKLLATTNPGMIQGPFGQLFTRGNHANLQYQIDGVQLPDSLSGTFGDAFSPADIERMEVITGGIPAEYGNRMAGVVNIITKSGPEIGGGSLDLNYGSFDQFAPQLNYGGSNGSGSLHYYVFGGYNQTGRGLDTPQPQSETQQGQGGRDVVHDFSSGNNEFAKLDWMISGMDKLSLVLFNEQKTFEIPNYPSSFRPSDPFFTGVNSDGSAFVDAYGNPSYSWAPADTGDTQSEANDYAELAYKRDLGDGSSLQLAPYWKYSALLFNNDPANDLASAAYGETPTSFYENRRVNNAGIKGDLTLRLDDRNLVKAGFQLQGSQASGPVSVAYAPDSVTSDEIFSSDNGVDKGYQESAYIQDDIQIIKGLVFNAGLRYDATQFVFADATSLDDLLQPRLGLSAMLTDSTKLHLFYGRLFQPAPAEDLRDTFNNLGTGQLTPYDIKAEKDDFYEAGLAQQFWEQVLQVNVYYKNATDMLDDTSLLNTAISQPYNFANGFAYGTEISLGGRIMGGFSDFLNYSNEIAEGQGINGGIFAFPAGTDLGGDYQFLDHVQINTANAGLSWAQGGFWATLSGLYGSGLRTGPNNSGSLPAHATMDATLGYQFKSDNWFGDWKLSGDLLNIFDDAYPITVANGYNGSHYAPGREWMVHLSKTL
jgi:outer membrane cobalamin receptor